MGSRGLDLYTERLFWCSRLHGFVFWGFPFLIRIVYAFGCKNFFRLVRSKAVTARIWHSPELKRSGPIERLFLHFRLPRAACPHKVNYKPCFILKTVAGLVHPKRLNSELPLAYVTKEKEFKTTGAKQTKKLFQNHYISAKSVTVYRDTPLG